MHKLLICNPIGRLDLNTFSGTAFASAFTYLDAKSIRVSPQMGGINGSIYDVLYDTYIYGLGNEFMERVYIF